MALAPYPVTGGFAPAFAEKLFARTRARTQATPLPYKASGGTEPDFVGTLSARSFASIATSIGAFRVTGGDEPDFQTRLSATIGDPSTIDFTTSRHAAPPAIPGALGVGLGTPEPESVSFSIRPGAATTSVRIYFGDALVHTLPVGAGTPATYTFEGARETERFRFVPYNGDQPGADVVILVPATPPTPLQSEFEIVPLTPTAVLLRSTNPDPEITHEVIEVRPQVSPSSPPRIVRLEGREERYREQEVPPAPPDEDTPVQDEEFVEPPRVYRTAVLTGLPAGVPHRAVVRSYRADGGHSDELALDFTASDNPLNRRGLGDLEAELGVPLAQISDYHRAEAIDFEEAAIHLLPSGLANDWESNNGRFARLIGSSMRHVNERLVRLVEELFPPAASNDTIADHESLVFNVNDPDYSQPATLSERRSALIARYQFEGGSSDKFFRDLMKSYGVVGASVLEKYSTRVGETRASDSSATSQAGRLVNDYVQFDWLDDGTLTQERYDAMISTLRSLIPLNVNVYVPPFPSVPKTTQYTLELQDSSTFPEGGTLVGVKDASGDFIAAKMTFRGTVYNLSSTALTPTDTNLDDAIVNGVVGQDPPGLVLPISIGGVNTNVFVPKQSAAFRFSPYPLLSVAFDGPAQTITRTFTKIEPN